MHGGSELTAIEITMIKNYKMSPNNKTIYYFFQKYKDSIAQYLLKKNHKYKNYIFEKGDTFPYIWEATKIVLSTINIEELQCQLSTIIFKVTYNKFLRLIRHFNNDAHKILNNAYSLDIFPNPYQKHEIIVNEEAKHNTNIDLNNFFKSFLKGKTKQQQDFIKRVIYLKSYGYSYRQIAVKLHTSLRKVFYVISKLQEEGKKYFNN